MDQRLRDRAGARRRGAHVDSRAPAIDRAADRRRGDRAAPADGRFVAAALPSVGDRVGAGQELGRLEPRLGGRRGPRDARRRRRRSAGRALEAARAELARAERLLAERAVPARRVEDARGRDRRRRGARSRGAGAARQRDETLRTGGGAAAGNAFVLRAPIAGRVAEVFAALGASYDEGAPLFRIVRTDRVELQAHVPPTDAATARHMTDDRARDSRVARARSRSSPTTCTTPACIDPETRALPVQFEVDNRAGQLLVGQTGTAILYTGADAAHAGRAEGGGADGGRPAVRVRPDWRRELRPALHRDRRRATAISSASRAASSQASASSRAARTTSSSRPPPGDCPRKATCTEGGR